VVPAFAKVNLGLEVLRAREDGFHELRTLFQTVDLHDRIRLRPHGTSVLVRCRHPGVPEGEANLAWRAADALRRFGGVRQGVEIEIDKRIPVAGGLGGGSSDAAAVLLALDGCWRLGLGAHGLHPLARRLGADVPYFLVGGTALGLGRGDEVYPLRRQVKAELVVVDPGLPVSTAAVFARLAARLVPRDDSRTIFRFVAGGLRGPMPFAALGNDLEPAALEEAPELAAKLARIRGILVGEGVLQTLLSGSGSSCFGIFGDARSATRARAALGRAGLRAHRCRTLSLDQYRRIWSRSLGATSRARGWDQGKERQHGDH
jgi:4-diphosphocytidyl-2-C-methyl-D-erythritol kinase